MSRMQSIYQKRERMDEPVIIESLKPVSHFAQRSYQFFHTSGSEFTLKVTYNPKKFSSSIEELKKCGDEVVLHTQEEASCTHEFRLPRNRLNEVKNILIEDTPSDREKINALFAEYLDTNADSELASD